MALKPNQGFQKGKNVGPNIQDQQISIEKSKTKLKKIARAKQLLRQGLSKAAAMRVIVKEFNLTRDPYAGTTTWMRQAASELESQGVKITPGKIDTGSKDRATSKRERVTGKDSTRFENRLTKDKRKTGLGKAYDTSHTANIFQAKNIGASYPVDALSNQPEKVNKIFAEKLNDELKPLYKKQRELLKKAKKSNNKMLMSAIDKNNFDISELVSSGGKQGDKAVNILRGWNIDPKTLKPYLPELGYNTLNSVDRGMSGLNTNRVPASSIDDGLIRANNLEQIKDLYAKEPKGSPIRKGFDNIVKCADGCFIKVANKNPEKILTKLNKNTDELKMLLAAPEVTNIKSPLVNSLSGQIRPELPSVKYNDITGAMVNTANGEKATAADMKKFEVDNPLKTVAGTEDAFKPIEKSMLKTVGRTLAKIGAPLPTALIDGYFVGKQVSEDKPAAEIAKDPLNWLGLATMSSLTKAGGLTKAGAAAPGTMSSILRMGMSPGLIRGVSRFAGLPGLAISTAMTAYDQYNKYKNEEGLIYNLFNDKAEPIE